MNIELFTLASEETLISITVFSAAFFFFLYQRISILKRKIAIYEESNASIGQISLTELDNVSDILSNLYNEYKKVDDLIYQQMASLRTDNLELKPRVINFHKAITNYSQNMQKMFGNIEMNLSKLHKMSKDCQTQELSTPLSMLNKNLTTAIAKLERVAISSNQQSDMINQLSNDFALIKRGHGVE